MKRLALYAFVRDVLWVTCGLKVALAWLSPTARQLDTGTTLLQAGSLAAFTLLVVIVPTYPRPGGPVPGGSLSSAEDQRRTKMLPVLAIAIVIALFLTKHLISSAVAGVFLATAAVFVVGLVVFSGPQPLRDAFWSAILALFLYLYALSGPTALSSFGGVAALVAVIWFVITRLPGKQVHAWTVRIASTFTGGATAYAFALLVAGIPFAVAFFRSASMWQPLFRSESAGLWREETRRGVALCDGAPPSPSPRDRVQLG